MVELKQDKTNHMEQTFSRIGVVTVHYFPDYYLFLSQALPPR